MVQCAYVIQHATCAPLSMGTAACIPLQRYDAILVFLTGQHVARGMPAGWQARAC